MDRLKKKAGPRRGFTLAELVLALGLLAMILVFTIGLFTTLLNSSSKSSNQTVGLYFAKAILDQTAAATNPANLRANASIYCMSTQSTANFVYNLELTPISNTLGPPTPPGGGYKGGYYAQVQVYWWDGDLSSARTGQGLMYTTVGRFIYPGVLVP